MHSAWVVMVWIPLKKVHYALAKSGVKGKQVYRFDPTTSREQLIYDEYIVDQLFLRPVCRARQTSFSWFLELHTRHNVPRSSLINYNIAGERCVFYHWIIDKGRFIVSTIMCVEYAWTMQGLVV